MVTLRVSGHFLGRFFSQGMLYEPIYIQEGLPKDAVFHGWREDPLDRAMILVDFATSEPGKTIEAKLVNVEPAARGH